MGIIRSNLVARKIKDKESTSSSSTRTTTTVVDETKNMIKKRIESIEDLEPKEVEDLIRIIRSLSFKSNNK